jgi:hypothetical protein
MNGRDRMRAIISGEKPDRLPIRPIQGWKESVERWMQEGLVLGKNGTATVSEAVGLIDPEAELLLPLDFNMCPRFKIKILEKEKEYVLLTDEFGVTKKMLRADFDRSNGYKTEAGQMSSMSEWLDFPVTNLDSWKEIYEQRFQPKIEDRLPTGWKKERSHFLQQSETRWVKLSVFPFFGLFGPIRELMGIEQLLFTMVDNPKLIHTIIDDLITFWLATLSEIIQGGIRVDEVLFFEDMCGTKAPIIGPTMFGEFLKPGYRKITNALRDLGVTLFTVDTDGNAWKLIPEMLEAGINGLHPCEVQAGMDAFELRSSFPSLYLNGGIAKGALTKGLKDIQFEIERRFKVAWSMNMYTPRLDHLAPPDISFENLKHYANIYLDMAYANPY